jgi:hypothetical protein
MNCKDIKDETKCLPPECKYVKTEKRQYCRSGTRKNNKNNKIQKFK